MDNKQCLTVSVNSALSTRRVAALGQRTRTPCLNTSPSTVCRAVCTPAGTTLSDQDTSPSTVCRAVSTPAGTTLSDRAKSSNIIAFIFITSSKVSLAPQRSSSRPLYSSSVSCDTGDSSRATECSDGLVLVDQFADDLLYSSRGFQVSAVFGISKYRDIGSVSVFFTARRYASAVYAVIVCLSVRHKLVYY